MISLKRIIPVLVNLSLVIGTKAQTVCINEIMQSNLDCYYYKHDFPDSWVELYNSTDTDIDIYDYAIGLTNSYASAYRFTVHETIKAKGWLVIPCDKQGSKLSTDFRLQSTEAGEIYLFDASGNRIDMLSHPAMPSANIAYGRDMDGQDVWGWELKPTPGDANTGGHSTILLPDPMFSMTGRVMISPTTVTISIPEGNLPSDTKIYVTTDGSEPTVNSTSATTHTFDVSQSTVIRAKLISANALSRPSLTQSYIFHPRTTTLPIISIVTSDSYLYGAEDGILSTAISSDGSANYLHTWRRPINAEYLGLAGDEPLFNQISETAVGGSYSREYDQKSLKLYANKRFGTKRFNGTFWAEKPNVTKSKSFMLRNGGNAFKRARINDAFAQVIFGRHIDVDYQEYAPAIVYINGVYKGEFGLRERSEEDYVEANYDGLEDIEIATHLSYQPSSDERNQTSFYKLYNLYRDSNSTYEQLAELMDVDNFMKTMIVEMFAENIDFPHNNISMWRPTTADGKWRWILKDLDYFAAKYSVPANFRMLKYLVGPVSKSDFEYKYVQETEVKEGIKIYQKMMSFPEFREAFIDAFSTYLGDFLKPSVTLPLLESMKAEIDSEIKETFKLYKLQMSDYNSYMDTLRFHCRKRPSYIYREIAEFFSLGSVVPMTLSPNGAEVTINGIRLTEGDFDGAYYTNRELRLNSGANNVGWEMNILGQDGNIVKKEEFAEPSVTLRLSDYSDCASVAFATHVFADSDFDQKLQELGIAAEDCKDWSDVSVINIAEPEYAYVNITGIDNLPEGKNDDLHAYLDFYDNAGNCFRKRILLNQQGKSTPKVNLSVSFCEDDWVGDVTPLISFGDWVSQDEFHLKAFYPDGMKGTAEVAYQLYSEITQRENCYPKAFPISLYVNGEFYGIMSWQLKKHRANMGLDKKESAHVWLDGTLNDKHLFGGTINWTKFEIRNPKDLYNMDGTDYDGDNPQEPIDATSSAWTGKTKMVRCAEAKQHIIELSNYNAVLSALEQEGTDSVAMRSAIGEHFDVDELVNYMVFSLVTNNYDGFSKNWQWFTYDGVKWTVAPYDCDLTFGYNEEGITLWPASQSSKNYDYRMSNADTNGPMYWIRNYFWDDVKARYAELRENDVISVDNIMEKFDRWTSRIGADNYASEWAKWTDSPIKMNEEENLDRVREWINDRIDLEDVYLGYKIEPASYDLSISDVEWATVCVPFSFQIPDDLDVYTIGDISEDGKSLVLDPEAETMANKPYLVHGQVGVYTLSGNLVVGSPSEPGYLCNGLLIGTLDDMYAPAGDYVLQNLNNLFGFYRVDSDNTVLITGNHAYLHIDSDRKMAAYRIQDISVTGIDRVGEANAPEILYNVYGQRLAAPGFGLNILKSSNGSTKKILRK